MRGPYPPRKGTVGTSISVQGTNKEGRGRQGGEGQVRQATRAGVSVPSICPSTLRGWSHLESLQAAAEGWDQSQKSVVTCQSHLLPLVWVPPAGMGVGSRGRCGQDFLEKGDPADWGEGPGG